MDCLLLVKTHVPIRLVFIIKLIANNSLLIEHLLQVDVKRAIDLAAAARVFYVRAQCWFEIWLRLKWQVAPWKSQRVYLGWFWWHDRYFALFNLREYSSCHCSACLEDFRVCWCWVCIILEQCTRICAWRFPSYKWISHQLGYTRRFCNASLTQLFFRKSWR